MEIESVLFVGVMVALAGGSVVWSVVSVFRENKELAEGDRVAMVRLNSMMGDGTRVVLSVGCSGRYPYRVHVEGQVFAFTDSARLGLWLDHLDDYLDWSSSESERAKHSPTALGYGVNAAHPVISL